VLRPYATPEQWGQEKSFPAGVWVPDNPLVVLQRDPPPDMARHLPRVSTLICGVENEDNDQRQDYSLRWEFTLGVGGARTPIRFDAMGFTRLAVPTEGFTLSLVVEPFPPPFPQGDVPAGTVHAFAFVAEGGIGHSYAEGATHSTPFEVETTLGADVFDVVVPPGASAMRVAGRNGTGGGISTPFRPQFLLQMRQGTSALATLVGEGAAPADPSLRTLYYSGLWLPLPGSMTNLEIAIADFPTVTRGVLQFKVDL
jgi:hypothetical protein